MFKGLVVSELSEVIQRWRIDSQAPQSCTMIPVLLIIFSLCCGRLFLGGSMDFVTNLFGGINFEAIVQLTMIGMIAVAGPVVIFLLAVRGGNL
jgi:Photosystem II complex subunit Ycf12